MGHAIGIEINQTVLNVAGVSTGRHPAVLGCASAELAKDWVTREGIAEPGRVAEKLQIILQQAQPKPLTSGEAYICLPESFIFRKVIELPVIADPDQERDMVRLHVSEFLPEPLEQMEVDYQVIPGSGTESRSYVVVATPQKVVEGYMAVCAAAHLHVAAIEPAAASVGRYGSNLRKPQPTLLIDIGKSMTTVAAYADLMVHLSSTVTIGAESAESEKDDPLSEKELLDRIEGLAAAVADEANHVSTFYSNRSGNHSQLAYAVVVGEGSLLANLPELLAKQMELPVRLGQPVMPVPPSCTRQYSAPLGAALYTYQEKV